MNTKNCIKSKANKRSNGVNGGQNMVAKKKTMTASVLEPLKIKGHKQNKIRKRGRKKKYTLAEKIINGLKVFLESPFK